MAEGQAYELALFGDARLRGPSGAVVPLGRRARALLAYLTLARDRQATRDRLCGLLWPDRGEPQARASLRQCLLEIRAAVARGDPDAAEALLHADRNAVALNGALTSDLARLQSLAAASDFTAALAAVAGEPLLDGLELGDAWDEWLFAQRAQLETRLAALVHTRLDALAADHDWDGVAALADAWTLRDGLDEPAIAAAIRADLARDAAPAARRRAKALADRLARDGLGAPGEAVRTALAGGAPVERPPEARPAVAPAHAVAASPADAPPMLRVAPFLDAELGGAQPHLAAALRDEIVSGLARYRDLRLVTADNDAGEAGAYLLVASLRPAGPAIALAARLLRADDHVVIWADRFELPGDALQSAIATIIGRIIAAVAPALTTDLVHNAPAAPTDLYRRYLVARQQSLRPPNHAAAQAAADELARIIDADPDFAQPRLALARIYNTEYVWTRSGSSPPALRARAMELAKQALALDRGDVQAWTLVGWCNIWRRNWAAAIQHFDLAVALNPFNVDRLLEVAYGLNFVGELDRTREILDRARALIPQATDGWYGDAGLFHMIQGEHDAAVTCFDMVAQPDLWMALHAAANAALAGSPDAALTARARAMLAAMQPDGAPPGCDALLAWVVDVHPFRYEAHRDLLVRGVELAFC